MKFSLKSAEKDLIMKIACYIKVYKSNSQNKQLAVKIWFFNIWFSTYEQISPTLNYDDNLSKRSIQTISQNI